MVAFIEKETRTGKKEYHYEISEDEWEIAGFVRNLNAEDFDLERELELILNCQEKIIDVLSNPNKFEKRLAKMLDIPIDNPKTHRLYNNVLLVNDEDKFCWGVGGIGGGKVYWTPYTSENEWKRREINTDIECDNCRVLAHEDLHGIGSHTEVEDFSNLIGIYFRLENLPEDEWGWDVRWNVSRWASKTEAYAEGKKSRDVRVGRNAFCAVYTRYPDETVELLEMDGWNEERIGRIVEMCKR